MNEPAGRSDGARVGHNGGPPLDDHAPPWGRNGVKSYFAWRAAREQAFSASRDVIVRRVRRAKACGVTYEQYTSFLLDTGRHLQPGDTAAIAEIKARSGA